jgi:hypothetical protein
VDLTLELPETSKAGRLFNWCRTSHSYRPRYHALDRKFLADVFDTYRECSRGRGGQRLRSIELDAGAKDKRANPRDQQRLLFPATSSLATPRHHPTRQPCPLRKQRWGLPVLLYLPRHAQRRGSGAPRQGRRRRSRASSSRPGADSTRSSYAQTVLHYGWIPFIIYVGYTRSNPQPSLIKCVYMSRHLMSVTDQSFSQAHQPAGMSTVTARRSCRRISRSRLYRKACLLDANAYSSLFPVVCLALQAQSNSVRLCSSPLHVSLHPSHSSRSPMIILVVSCFACPERRV